MYMYAFMQTEGLSCNRNGLFSRHSMRLSSHSTGNQQHYRVGVILGERRASTITKENEI